MPIFIGDSDYFSSSWTVPEMAATFSDASILSRWLQVLGTLAEAQETLGLIPKNAAKEIKKFCKVDLYPVETLRKHYQSTGHSTAGLIKAFYEKSSRPAADYFYFAATVQDITDTANSLALREIEPLLKKEFNLVLQSLNTLIQQHRETPMLGRTHGQGGTLITFGFKLSIYFQEFQNIFECIMDSIGTAQVVQMAGAVGGLNAWGEKALEIRKEVARHLQLKDPIISWTNSRYRLQQLVSHIHLASAGLSRLANEIYNLQRTGIEELKEGQGSAQINSISMPHKKNPEVSEQIGTLGGIIRSMSFNLMENSTHEHERDGKAWKSEWACWPTIISSFATQLRLMQNVLNHLQVDKMRMKKNIESTQGHCFSDALLFSLGQKLGLVQAREIMANIYQEPKVLSQPLKEVAQLEILRHKKIDFLNEIGFDEIFQIENNIKNCVLMCDDVLALPPFEKKK